MRLVTFLDALRFYTTLESWDTMTVHSLTASRLTEATYHREPAVRSLFASNWRWALPLESFCGIAYLSNALVVPPRQMEYLPMPCPLVACFLESTAHAGLPHFAAAVRAVECRPLSFGCAGRHSIWLDRC